MVIGRKLKMKTAKWNNLLRKPLSFITKKVEAPKKEVEMKEQKRKILNDQLEKGLEHIFMQEEFDFHLEQSLNDDADQIVARKLEEEMDDSLA
jgi:hypothetical protein